MNWLDFCTFSCFPLGLCLKSVHQLVYNMLNVCATLGSADGVDERAMLEAIAIGLGHKHLPTLPKMCVYISLAGVEKGTVVLEVLHGKFLTIKVNCAPLHACTCNVEY